MKRLAALLLVALASADTLLLKDGRVLEGTIVEVAVETPVLFLYGARDHLIDPVNLGPIKPPDWGLATVTLPGINHFLVIGEEWRNWFPLVVRLIHDFEEHASVQLISARELTGSREGCVVGSLRTQILGSSVETNRRVAELRNGLQEKVGAGDAREWPIGVMMWSMGLLTTAELLRALDLQKHAGSGKLFGQVVEEMGLARREWIDAIVCEQTRRRASPASS